MKEKGENFLLFISRNLCNLLEQIHFRPLYKFCKILILFFQGIVILPWLTSFVENRCKSIIRSSASILLIKSGLTSRVISGCTQIILMINSSFTKYITVSMKKSLGSVFKIN